MNNRHTDPVTLLEVFFQQLYLEQRFEVINDENVTGWENWLQIELTYFFNKKVTNEDGQWWREYAITWPEMPNDRKSCKPDFWLWAGKEHSYSLIEFKQSPKDNNDALEGLKSDINKLSTLNGKFTCTTDTTTTQYHCDKKVFVLVSKYEPPKLVDNVKCSKGGRIGGSPYFYGIYTT